MSHINQFTLKAKTEVYLQMAQNADRKIKGMQDWNQDERADSKFEDETIETAKLVSNRVWNRYLVLKEKLLINPNL